MFWNKSNFKFSRKSMKELETCHPELQRLFKEVIKQFDCSVIGGYRSNEQQEEFYRKGFSKLRGGQSKHNYHPSLAVDVCPYPIDWENKERFILFAGYVKGVANRLGIKIRWGGDWDSDNFMKDQTFNDLPHFELIK